MPNTPSNTPNTKTSDTTDESTENESPPVTEALAQEQPDTDPVQQESTPEQETDFTATEHALAAASSPAEILTSELLIAEKILPISEPQSEAQPESDVKQTQDDLDLSAEKTDQTDTTPTDSTPQVEPAQQKTHTEQEDVKPASPQAALSPQDTATEPSLSFEVEPQSTPTPNAASTQEAIIQAKPPLRRMLDILMRPSVLMVLSAFLFSSMILFVKLASVYYTSFEIISARGLIGALCILMFRLIKFGPVKGIQSLKTKYLPMQAWRAFIGTMSMMCWFYGVSKLSLALSTTINYMSSIWIAIFIISTAFMTGSSRPSIKLVLSILVGFGGILIILRPSATDVDMFAAAIVVIASVFGALAYLQVAALGRVGEPAYRTVFYFCSFGVIFGLIATFATQGKFSDFSLVGVAWLILIGVLAMLAQFCLTLAYTGGNALVNASLQYSGLIFVIFFDWILGTGWPDYFTWLGMALVVASGLIATALRAKP